MKGDSIVFSFVGINPDKDPNTGFWFKFFRPIFFIPVALVWYNNSAPEWRNPTDVVKEREDERERTLHLFAEWYGEYQKTNNSDPDPQNIMLAISMIKTMPDAMKAHIKQSKNIREFKGDKK